MRCRRAVIDSLNLSTYDIENVFDSEDYIIELIKSIGVFEPKVWLKEFGKHLTRNIKEALIIFTHTGLAIPIKTYTRSPNKQTIEFAGLQGYNERSKLLNQVLRDKKSQLSDAGLMRIDVAIDYKRVPKKIKQKILENRKLYKHKNSEYLKTAKEGKANKYININIYDKAKKECLDYSLTRLEFSFRGGYFKGLLLKDMDKAILKMEKSIKKITGVDAKIEGI